MIRVSNNIYLEEDLQNFCVDDEQILSTNFANFDIFLSSFLNFIIKNVFEKQLKILNKVK